MQTFLIYTYEKEYKNNPLHGVCWAINTVYLSLFWISKPLQMKDPINIWGIKEFEGDGINCPIVPANLPWYKKLALTFFRFGICPACVTMSLTYSIGRFSRNFFKPTEKA